MTALDRSTPKEIKAWCEKVLDDYYRRRLAGLGHYDEQELIQLMYKAYKRGYKDALSG